MGLLDTLMDQLTGQSHKSAASPALSLARICLEMFSSKDGFTSLLKNFEAAGLGNLIHSWISNGENLPITAAGVEQGLGAGTLHKLAESTGLTYEKTAIEMSELLPALIDKLTPDGAVPSLANISGTAGAWVEKLFKHS